MGIEYRSVYPGNKHTSGRVVTDADGVIYWEKTKPDGTVTREVLQDKDSLCGAGIFETGPDDPFRASCGWHDHAYTNREWFEDMGWDREKIDFHFYELMLVEAQGDTLLNLRAAAYYHVVRDIGWICYYKHPAGAFDPEKVGKDESDITALQGITQLTILHANIISVAVSNRRQLISLTRAALDAQHAELNKVSTTADQEYADLTFSEPLIGDVPAFNTFRKFGWKKDITDIRDTTYRLTRSMSELPAEVDLRRSATSILNQGSLGSCTAHALVASHMFAQSKQGRTELFLPSRLFVYYCEREREGTIESDAGASIRDGIKSLAESGVCPEIYWTYNDSDTGDRHTFRTRPSNEAYRMAAPNKISEYRRIKGIVEMMDCLASGDPVVFGFSVYESFMSQEVARTGMVPFPDYRTESLLGGHAVMAVGYKPDPADSKNVLLIVQNSWGASWGDKGFFYLPEAFITQRLADDMWTITHVA